jgi:hypothetical protein
LKNITAKKKLHLFDQKLQFTFLLAFIKDVFDTGEALSPQKRTSSTSKNLISSLFYIFVVIYALLDPDLDMHSQFGSGSGYK